MTSDTAIRAERPAPGFVVGGPALYLDQRPGSKGLYRRRVTILSDEKRDRDLGAFRQCAFLDEMGEVYEVEARRLEACDDQYQPLAALPADLASPRSPKVGSIDHPGGGRVYAPEPYLRRRVVHPPEVQQALARYDRIDATPPMDVRVNAALMTPSQVQRLNDAVQKFEDAKTGPHRTRRRLEARAVLLDLQKELSAQASDLAVAQGQVETIKTANRRGEEVELKDTKIRMKTRDGLRSLYEKEHLTDRQYGIGTRYREAVEARAGDVGSQMGGEGPGAGHRHEQFVAARAERAFQMDWAARVERAVALQCIGDPAALQLLRWVAGEGQAISAFGKGRTFHRHVRALSAALDVASTIRAQSAEEHREAWRQNKGA